MSQDLSLFQRLYVYFRTMDYEQGLRFLYLFSIVFGFVIRVIVSMTAWGMKHPDEVYQSLEIAHIIVYEAGVIAPEFRNYNPVIQSYAAARSWLFPMFFAAFMYVGEFLGLDYFTQILPLIKFYMAIHATLLIPAVYKLIKYLTEDQLSATIAAFLVAFWFRIIEYTVRTFTNTFFLPMIFYGIYKVLVYLDDKEQSKGEPDLYPDQVVSSFDLQNLILRINNFKLLQLLQIGFLLGLSTYIRVDLGIIIFAFFIVYFKKSHLLEYFKIGFSGALFWILGGIVDYNLYEGVRFFSVIINWFTFNIIEGYSDLFGVSGPLNYVANLILADLLIPWVAIIIIWPLINSFRQKPFNIFRSKIGQDFKKIAYVNLIVWFIYSNPITFEGGLPVINQTHKEIRFLIGGTVTLLMQIAILMRMMTAELSRNYVGIEKSKHDSFMMNSFEIRQVRKYFIVLFLVTFLVFSFSANSFRNPGDQFEGFNRSYTYIGMQGDAERIYTYEVWYVTGGYTYSHADEKTTFYYLNRDNPNNFVFNLQIVVINRIDDVYIVLPWYFQNDFPEFIPFMEQNSWEQVYAFDGVFTYTLAS